MRPHRPRRVRSGLPIPRSFVCRESPHDGHIRGRHAGRRSEQEGDEGEHMRASFFGSPWDRVRLRWTLAASRGVLGRRQDGTPAPPLKGARSLSADS